MADQNQNNPPEPDPATDAESPEQDAQHSAPRGDAGGSDPASQAGSPSPGPSQPSTDDADGAADSANQGGQDDARAAGDAGGGDSDDHDPENALHNVEHAADEVAGAASELNGDAEALNFPAFANGAHHGGAGPASLELLKDVDLSVKVELGRTRMFVEDVLKLNENTVVELDKAAGDPVDIFVNGRLVARGEVLVLNENFCVRVSEIISDLSTGTPKDESGSGSST